MARELFKLIGLITMEGVENVEKHLKAIDKQAVRVGKEIDKFGKSVSKVGTGLSKFVSGPLAAVGVGMAALAGKTGEFAEELLNLEQTTGLSTTALQKYKYVADTVGVGWADLVNKAQVLTAKLQGIDKDGSNANKAMEALGISSRNSTGALKSMDELFPEVISGLQSITDVTERNRIAQNLFGKDLKSIAPILGMSAEELRSMGDEAERLGLVLDSKAIKAAAEFDDQVGKLKSQFNGLLIRLGSDIIPLIRDFFIPIIEKNVIPAVKGFVDKIKSVIDWFNRLSPGTKDIIVKMGLFAVAMGPVLMITGQFISMLKGMPGILVKVTMALMANPWAAVAIAIAGVTTALGLLIWKTLEYRRIASDKQKRTAEINAINQQIIELTNMKKVYGELIEEQEKLKKSGSSLFNPEKLSFAKEEIEKISKKIKELNESVNGPSEEAPTDSAPANKGGFSFGNADEKKKKLEERAKINQEFTAKINELTLNRIELLKIEEREAIASAQKVGADTNQITAFYALQRENVISEEAEKRKEIERQFLEEKEALEQRYTDAIKYNGMTQIEILNSQYSEALENANRYHIDKFNIEKYYENEIAKEKERLRQEEEQKRFSMIDKAIGYYQYFSSAIGSIVSGITDNHTINIDNQLATEKAAIEASTLGNEEKQKRIQAAELEADKKKRELMREQAKREKVAGIFSVVINTAQSIMKAYADLGPIFGTVAAVLMGVIGAVQIATIASKPLPLAEGGLIKKRDGGVNAIVGEGDQDEMVMPLETGVQSFFDKFVNKIRSIEMPTSTSVGLAGAGGSVAGNVHFHVGTLVADDNGIKQLEQRMRGFRISEDQRRGL